MITHSADMAQISIFTSGTELEAMHRGAVLAASKYGYKVSCTKSTNIWKTHGSQYDEYGLYCTVNKKNKLIRFTTARIAYANMIAGVFIPGMFLLVLEKYITEEECSEFALRDRDIITEEDISIVNRIIPGTYPTRVGGERAYHLLAHWGSGSKINKWKMLPRIDNYNDYVFVSFSTRVGLAFCGIQPLTINTKIPGMLAKKTHVEEMIGCTLEEFYAMIPSASTTMDFQHVRKTSYLDRQLITIGNKVVDPNIFIQHTDIPINIFESMILKSSGNVSMVNHDLILASIDSESMTVISHYISKTPSLKITFDVEHEPMLICNCAAIRIGREIEVKDYSVYKEGLTLKILRNETSN